MPKKLRISVMMQAGCVPPKSDAGLSEQEMMSCKTEYHVLQALKRLGHDAEPLVVASELNVIREAISIRKPHVVFNLLEEFRGLDFYVPYVLGYLELIRQPYTGCNPRGLLFATSKALQRKILRHHRILVPDFYVVPYLKKTRRPARMQFPLIVKSATAHGSVGIAQASVVHDDEKLNERIAFIHHELSNDAIIEEYVEGRELYVALLGNQRIEAFPIWEMIFEKLPDGAANIATSKIKWDTNYQQRIGLKTGAAENLTESDVKRIIHLCKRAYRVLNQSGYARIDLRMTADGRVYVIESNPNPQIAIDEEFAESALMAGVDYESLLTRIIQLGTRYHAGLE